MKASEAIIELQKWLAVMSDSELIDTKAEHTKEKEAKFDDPEMQKTFLAAGFLIGNEIGRRRKNAKYFLAATSEYIKLWKH